MSDAQNETGPAVVYRYEGPAQYWGLPDRDLTQEDLDSFTPTQLRELNHAKSYTRIEQVDLTKLNRKELEALATERGIAGPYERFKLNRDLVEVLTNGEPPAPPVDPGVPVQDAPAAQTADTKEGE